MKKLFIAFLGAVLAANTLLVVIAAFGAISVVVVLFRLTGLFN